MITEITFDKVKEHQDEDESGVGYEFLLPALNGRSFKFKPNLNVIVGKNGCGKTSLLNVMRALTFSSKKVYSKFKNLFQVDEVHDYFAHAKMKANYKYGFFNNVNVREFRDNEIQGSLFTFARFFDTNNGESSGESKIRDIESVFDTYLNNGEGSGEDKARSFKETVVKQLERYGCSGGGLEEDDSKVKDILKYYQENHDDNAKGWTFFFDEPDAGLDIENLENIYNFLEKVDTSPNPLQYVCVLHNVALIKKLMDARNADGTPKVNFIELSRGYLQQVIEFLN